jgi:stage IV sporulation protein FB
MLLAEPQRTPYDLHFRLLGIPVRISPFFWVANALLGFNWARGLNILSAGHISVGLGLLLWILAVLISIIVHEFGHAMAFRYYGVDADVVLYHFGGLAIPRRAYTGRVPWQDPKKQIVISAAGPAAEILLGIVVIALLYAGGFAVVNPLPFIPQLEFLSDGKPLPSLALEAFVEALVYVSIWWALLNLLPIYPLDGGQISREIFTIGNPREGIRYSLILSVAVGAAVAVWAFMHQNTFMAIMFAMLAYSSFATLQAYFGRGGGFGGGRF